MYRQVTPFDDGSHVGIMFPEFLASNTEWPKKFPLWRHEMRSDALFGRTCIINTHFEGFNRKCGNIRDSIIRTNPWNYDRTYPIRLLTGNTAVDVNADDIVQFHRPRIESVNIAECIDLFCEGLKKAMVVDEVGDVFGKAGTWMAESEYEWDGITRLLPNGSAITYSDTADGLSNDRIPAAMKTDYNGELIDPTNLYMDVGVTRTAGCVYNPWTPGWFCPDKEIRYFGFLYEMMDDDHMTRRLTPVAIKSETGYLDILNNPSDKSRCFGYSCSLRQNVIYSIMACGLQYDYYLSSTNPMKVKLRFLYAPLDCVIKIRNGLKSDNLISNQVVVINGYKTLKKLLYAKTEPY